MRILRKKRALKPPGVKPKRPVGQAKGGKAPAQAAADKPNEAVDDIAAEAPTLRQSTRQRVEEAQKERQRVDQVSHMRHAKHAFDI